MKQFKVGVHKTKSGDKAVVAKLVMKHGEWLLKGAIQEPTNGVLYVAYWSLSGISVSGLPAFNLEEFA